MKTYNAPKLASKDTVTEATRFVVPGTEDPRNPTMLQKDSVGSVGFQL
jgi:hypothetical protein